MSFLSFGPIRGWVRAGLNVPAAELVEKEVLWFYFYPQIILYQCLFYVKIWGGLRLFLNRFCVLTERESEHLCAVMSSQRGFLPPERLQNTLHVHNF